jgi:hypothetical protein
MRQTKNAAELCVLLIRELYGQLPSVSVHDGMRLGRISWNGQ